MSGSRIDALHPASDDIDIVDIARALSRLARWNGHTSKFLSVAEHSVLLARFAPAHLRADALMHDATEAYVGDVVRPLKYMAGMHAYRRCEYLMAKAIAERFDLSHPTPDEVKRLDDRMLRTEIAQLMPSGSYSHSRRVRPLDVTIECWSPSRAEREFMRTARELGIDP